MKHSTQLSKRPSFESLLTRQFADPEHLCAYVARHVRYKADPKERDHWQTPEETWKRGLGDCEDLAALVHKLATAHGFPAPVHVVFSSRVRSGHAFVNGFFGEQRWAFSNGKFVWLDYDQTATGFVLAQVGWAPVGIYTIPVRPEAMYS